MIHIARCLQTSATLPVNDVLAMACARAAATFMHMLLRLSTKMHPPLGLGSAALLVRWIAPKDPHELSDLLQMSEGILGHIVRQVAHEVHI